VSWGFLTVREGGDGIKEGVAGMDELYDRGKHEHLCSTARLKNTLCLYRFTDCFQALARPPPAGFGMDALPCNLGDLKGLNWSCCGKRHGSSTGVRPSHSAGITLTSHPN
jgi:hypothetical protein